MTYENDVHNTTSQIEDFDVLTCFINTVKFNWYSYTGTGSYGILLW